MSLLWMLLGVAATLPWIVGMEYLRREQEREIQYWYDDGASWMNRYFELRRAPLGHGSTDDTDYSDLFDYEDES